MSRWERDDPSIVRVEQTDSRRPDPRSWVTVLEQHVSGAPGRVFLVAHSCGVSTVLHWSSPNETRVVGALLVAPPDAERGDLPTEVRCFGPVPRPRLPFAATVVASRTDPNCSFSRATNFARWWGSKFVDAGDAGHINTASGHGPWPEGDGADFITNNGAGPVIVSHLHRWLSNGHPHYERYEMSALAKSISTASEACPILARSLAPDRDGSSPQICRPPC